MLIAFSVTPLGVGEGVGEIVAEAIRVVRDSGLPNQTDSMFTALRRLGRGPAVVKAAVERSPRGRPGSAWCSRLTCARVSRTA